MNDTLIMYSNTESLFNHIYVILKFHAVSFIWYQISPLHNGDTKMRGFLFHKE
jgi:hypothetical protein